jgi:hypothetical protein
MDCDHFTTRQPRAAEGQARKLAIEALDREELIRHAAVLTDADGSISGFTIVTPQGTSEYIDAAMLRRSGGHA